MTFCLESWNDSYNCLKLMILQADPELLFSVYVNVYHMLVLSKENLIFVGLVFG